MTSRLLLEFNEHSAVLQAAPTAAILIQEPVVDSSGNTLLSTRCTNLAELDAEIDRIKNRLDLIREEASAKFQPMGETDVHQEILDRLGVVPDPEDGPEYGSL
jgi:hypothetical protein